MTSTAVIVALVLGVTYLVIRQRRTEVREWREYLDAVREDAINKARYGDLGSDTPTYDALALERLRAGLEGWGK